MITRKAAILGLFEDGQIVNVRALASQFDVSQETILSDLEELSEDGSVVIANGGLLAIARPRNGDAASIRTSIDRKKAIGKLAATLIKPRSTVLIDGSTTALEVARNVPRDAGIVVATTSLCVAQLLHNSQVDVLVLGGLVRKEFPSTYGPVAEAALSSFHVDVLFMGCNSAHSVDGLYTTEIRLSTLQKAMIRVADRVVLATESAKFGRRGFIQYAAPSDIHIVVTDDGLSREDRANLEEQGVHVLIAQI